MKLAAVAAVASIACKGDARREAPASAPAPTAPADAATVDAPVVAAIVATPIAAGSPPPAQARKGYRVLGGATFTDELGTNRVVVLEKRGATTTALSVLHLIGDGAGERLLIELKDLAEGCPGDATGFAEPLVEITDLDRDRTAEIGLAYHVGCADGDVKLKSVVLEGGVKFIVRGSADTDGTPDPDPAQWPKGALAAARDRYVAARAAPQPPPVAVRSNADFAQVEVERDGKFEIRVSYPRLDGIPAAAATALTRDMRELVRADDTPAREANGSLEADCVVGIATPELIAITCRRLHDERTDADVRAGTGGAPGDYTRTAINVWLADPALAPVDPAELLGDVATLTARCGPVAPDELALDAETISALQSEEDDPRPEACTEDALTWADARPRTARAKAFVARLVEPPDGP